MSSDTWTFKLPEKFRTFRTSRVFYQKKRKNENKANILELMSHYDILCKVIVTCRTESRAQLNKNFRINKGKL